MIVDCDRLEPKDDLVSGVYEGECRLCLSKIKFRVHDGTTAARGADACKSSNTKSASSGCCGKCDHKSDTKQVASPSPVTSITFTLNGNQVSHAASLDVDDAYCADGSGDCEQSQSDDDTE